jgi:hypothetical protein
MAGERQRRIQEDAQQHIAELEQKVWQQALPIDFLLKVSKQVEELRHDKCASGATASTGRSGE